MTRPSTFRVSHFPSQRRRVWASPKGVELCVHPYEPDEPQGYVAWHEWSRAYARTHRQTACSTPGCPIRKWEPREEA